MMEEEDARNGLMRCIPRERRDCGDGIEESGGILACDIDKRHIGETVVRRYERGGDQLIGRAWVLAWYAIPPHTAIPPYRSGASMTYLMLAEMPNNPHSTLNASQRHAQVAQLHAPRNANLFVGRKTHHHRARFLKNTSPPHSPHPPHPTPP